MYFTITGTVDVDPKLTPHLDHMGNIVGFQLPDGRILRPVMGLEIESTDGNTFTYTTKELQFAAYGLYALDYDTIEFTPTE